MVDDPQSEDVVKNRAELVAAREALQDQIWTLENSIPTGGRANWSGEPNPIIARLKADLAEINQCIDDIDAENG